MDNLLYFFGDTTQCFDTQVSLSEGPTGSLQKTSIPPQPRKLEVNPPPPFGRANTHATTRRQIFSPSYRRDFVCVGFAGWLTYEYKLLGVQWGSLNKALFLIVLKMDDPFFQIICHKNHIQQIIQKKC